MKQINILVVPDWVQVALTAGGGNYGTLLQPEKLLSILSKDDVAFYLRTSELFSNFVGLNGTTNKALQINESFNTVISPVLIAMDNADLAAANLRLTLELGYPSSTAEYLSFLHKHGSNGCDTADAGKHVGFDVLSYDYDCYIIRPKAVSTKELYSCYESLISYIHKFEPIHEIAELPIFTGFENGLNCNL